MTASITPPANTAGRTPRRPWQRPALRAAGTLGEVLKGGASKVTATADSGPESGKVPGGDDF